MICYRYVLVLSAIPDDGTCLAAGVAAYRMCRIANARRNDMVLQSTFGHSATEHVVVIWRSRV